MAKNLNKSNIENVLLPLINAFQNDEKEKLNHLGNISKSLIEVRKKVKEEMEKLPPQFNLLENIRNKTSKNSLQKFETYNSDLLHYLLNIKRENINFTKLFLEYLQNEKKIKFYFNLNKINYKNIKVDKEYYTTVKIEEEGIEKNGRIDILIHGNINNKETKKSFAIIIENKIKADDQDAQLERYYKYISKTKGYGNNVYVIYLTPKIKPPKEYSLSEEYIKEIGERFKNITHGDIGRWLETILKNKEYNFLHENDFRLLKSALIQIIDNEKSISGENEEGEMTNPKIEEVLERELFQKIKNENGNIETDEIQSYIDMFQNQVIPLLEKKIVENRKAIIEKDIKPCLKFTKEVAKYLKSKGYKEGKDYNLLKDEDIINDMSVCGYPHHIEFNINNIELLLESNYENECISYYFGIYTFDNNMLTKIIKKLKNSIKNIFNGFEYEYKERKGWIFIYYINIEKDNPQKIAQAMIDLYELLKKEIK